LNSFFFPIEIKNSVCLYEQGLCKFPAGKKALPSRERMSAELQKAKTFQAVLVGLLADYPIQSRR
jgi:hypothetical protein